GRAAARGVAHEMPPELQSRCAARPAEGRAPGLIAQAVWTAVHTAHQRNGARERAPGVAPWCSAFAPLVGVRIARGRPPPRPLLPQVLKPLEALRDEGQAGVDLTKRDVAGVEDQNERAECRQREDRGR